MSLREEIATAQESATAARLTSEKDHCELCATIEQLREQAKEWEEQAKEAGNEKACLETALSDLQVTHITATPHPTLRSEGLTPSLQEQLRASELEMETLRAAVSKDETAASAAAAALTAELQRLGSLLQEKDREILSLATSAELQQQQQADSFSTSQQQVRATRRCQLSASYRCPHRLIRRFTACREISRSSVQQWPCSRSTCSSGQQPTRRG